MRNCNNQLCWPEDFELRTLGLGEKPLCPQLTHAAALALGLTLRCMRRCRLQVEDFELRTFDAKRDRWNGYDADDWVKQAER